MQTRQMSIKRGGMDVEKRYKNDRKHEGKSKQKVLVAPPIFILCNFLPLLVSFLIIILNPDSWRNSRSRRVNSNCFALVLTCFFERSGRMAMGQPGTRAALSAELDAAPAFISAMFIFVYCFHLFRFLTVPKTCFFRNTILYWLRFSTRTKVISCPWLHRSTKQFLRS